MVEIPCPVQLPKIPSVQLEIPCPIQLPKIPSVQLEKILFSLSNFCRTDIFLKSVTNLGTKLYNKLPNYIKKPREFKTF
jgi:hypothetical protein